MITTKGDSKNDFSNKFKCHQKHTPQYNLTNKQNMHNIDISFESNAKILTLRKRPKLSRILFFSINL